MFPPNQRHRAVSVTYFPHTVNTEVIAPSNPPCHKWVTLISQTWVVVCNGRVLTMIRKNFGSTHEEALARLCFVCGEIIKETIFYEVEKNLDLLSAGLKCPDLFSIPDVTPLHFCRKCQRVLTNVRDARNGGIVKSGRTLLDWEECGENCKTCGYIMKRKQVRGRHKKVRNFSFIH